jgi:hypothetical protein
MPDFYNPLKETGTDHKDLETEWRTVSEEITNITEFTEGFKVVFQKQRDEDSGEERDVLIAFNEGGYSCITLDWKALRDYAFKSIYPV